MKTIDRISDALGLVGAVLLFLAGVFLTYEVTARYVFRAPTTWAQEVSELCLLWGVFLMLGRLIARRENITIEVLYVTLAPRRQRLIDIFANAFMLVTFLVLARYGYELALDSIQRGTTTGTIVDIPKWWVEAAAPVGAAWAAVQSAVEFSRAVTGRDWAALSHHGRDI